MKTNNSPRQLGIITASEVRFHRSYVQTANNCPHHEMKKVLRRILVVSLALAAAVNLSGCFWLAAGGAGAVGYKVGTDERSVGTQLDDATITSKVNAKLIAEPGIRSLNIDVDTLDGNVTLSGYVKTEEQIKRVVSIALSVKGVKSVKSNLKVKGR